MREIIPGVLYHHERYDGKGYPEGLSGQDIPFSARIIALADAFDAMTSRRVYRDAMSIRRALSEVEKGVGCQFDPIAARAFLDSPIDQLWKVIQDGFIETWDYSNLKNTGQGGRSADSMKIQTQIQNDIAILQLQEFTIESLKSFEEAVSNRAASRNRRLILDMSRVILLDSASLEKLIELNDQCRQQSRQMKLAGLDETCQKILEITRLLPQLDTYAELTEAVRSFV